MEVRHRRATALVFPSLGPTAFLFFFMPLAPGASPRHALYGHALGLACGFGAGHFWVSVQARMDYLGGRGQWGWTVRTVQSNAGAAWRVRYGCNLNWGRRTLCIAGVPDPDQVYRLRGRCLATHTGAPCPARPRTVRG